MRLTLLCAFFFSLSAFAANPVVVIDTNQGSIEMELFEDKAPVTVKNFLSYVDDKFYDNTIFHRVINGFMIQGGGFEEGMKEKKTKAPIINEAKNGLRNDEGTVAMARTNDPNSATAQFFINVNNNDSLNYPQPDGHGYTVFGKVTKGMHVVNRIKMVKTGNIGYHQNVPMDTVMIKSIRRVGGEAPAAAAAPAPAPEKKAAPLKKPAKKKKK
ncbi:MAG: peptidylprolyl isomerase [Bacteriovoracaceae bacterium]